MWREAGRVVESGKLLVPISVYSGFLERFCKSKLFQFQTENLGFVLLGKRKR